MKRLFILVLAFLSVSAFSFAASGEYAKKSCGVSITSQDKKSSTEKNNTADSKENSRLQKRARSEEASQKMDDKRDQTIEDSKEDRKK